MGAGKGWLGATTLVLLGFGPLAAHGQKVTAVPQLDLTRFVGTWYEIARLPDKAQKLCAGDAFDMYALGEKPDRFSLVTSCRFRDGTEQVRNLSGRRAGKSGNVADGDGRLKVTTIWPFSTARWVLAVGPQYEWVLVGSPNRKTLWVMSKTATMTPEVLQGIEGQAATEGFAVSKMVSVSQQP